MRRSINANHRARLEARSRWHSAFLRQAGSIHFVDGAHYMDAGHCQVVVGHGGNVRRKLFNYATTIHLTVEDSESVWKHKHGRDTR